MFYYDITCDPCFQPSFYGYFNSFFILFWTFSTGLFFSAFIVSHALYNHRSPFYIHKSSHLHELHPDSDSDSDSQVMYTDLFPINNHNHNIPGDNTHIIENTPNGNVIMSYSQVEEGFIYYADKNIPFDVLETVARKFCNSFDCGALYVSRKPELDNNDSEDIPENEILPRPDTHNHTDTDKLNDSPFASLKNYNINSNTTLNNSHLNATTHSATACKFVRKGKFNDFTPIIHSPSPSKKISFKDFKNSL